MKYEQWHKISCKRKCGQVFQGEHDYDVLNLMLDHIRNIHPVLFKTMTRRGRKMAMSQNGQGYYDDGKTADGDWITATRVFRDAWRTDALREVLGMPNT